MQNMNKLDDVHFLLYVKDKFNISNKAWYELSSRVQNLPTVYGLRKRMQELNAQWHIAPTPGPTEGVQVKLEESLLEHVPRLISSGRMKENDVLQLKISGDGTRVGKRLQLLNVTFTIINEGHTAATEKGNYVLAIIKAKDDYQTINESLSDLRKEMLNLKSIQVGEKTFAIQYFLGRDWTFLVTICGIGPANQEYAGIWCWCPRSLRHDTSKEWPLITGKDSRTIENITKIIRPKYTSIADTNLFLILLKWIV